jgi:hypothetical protein
MPLSITAIRSSGEGVGRGKRCAYQIGSRHGAKWNAGLCFRISLRSIQATLTPRYLLAAIDARCDGASAGVASRKASQRASTAARTSGTNYGLSRCFTLLGFWTHQNPPERKNLTLRNLTDLVDESLKMPIAQLIDKAIADAKFARDWRDRVIAH